MPMVRVEMFAGRTDDQKQRLARAVTDAFVEICGGTPQSVHIVFSDVEKSDWAVAGQLCSSPPAAADAPRKSA